MSLEIEFASRAFCDVDVEASCKAFDFLNPNEANPEKVQEHLAKTVHGIIVSTGTERSFFDLILSPACEGLVVRDINPRVKAYVDFVVLLLRISETREEFNALSDVKDITGKLEQGSLPENVKRYYLKHVASFAKIYHKLDKDWKKDKRFEKVRYDLHDDQFQKLQKYAREGNIIATVGDINDLTFLRNRKVSVVDASNIHNYSLIDLQGEGDFHPRVIQTLIIEEETTYSSFVHTPLTSEERAEFYALFNRTPMPFLRSNFTQLCKDNDPFDAHGTAVSPKTLERLRKFV